jgi:hypothetical protein
VARALLKALSFRFNVHVHNISRRLAAILLVVFATSAWAIPITGSVDFFGTIKLNGNLGVATGTSVSTVYYAQGDGAFGDVVDPTAVTFASFQWNPASVPVNSLWSFTDMDSGWSYRFSLAAITGFTQSNTDLDVAGVGSLFITGIGSEYEETAGKWNFTITDVDGAPNLKTSRFGFSSNSGVPVPDGGIPILALGATMVSLAMVGRSKSGRRRGL